MDKNNTWNIRHLIDRTIDPAYYTENCRISGLRARFMFLLINFSFIGSPLFHAS